MKKYKTPKTIPQLKFGWGRTIIWGFLAWGQTTFFDQNLFLALFEIGHLSVGYHRVEESFLRSMVHSRVPGDIFWGQNFWKNRWHELRFFAFFTFYCLDLKFKSPFLVTFRKFIFSAKNIFAPPEVSSIAVLTTLLDSSRDGDSKNRIHFSLTVIFDPKNAKIHHFLT